MIVEISAPVLRETVPIAFMPSLCSARTLMSTVHAGARLALKPPSSLVRFVERFASWKSGRSAAAAALTSANCVALGAIGVPSVADPVCVSRYGAALMAPTRPLTLTAVLLLLVAVLEGTSGTSHVPGSVSVFVPVPLYGVW
jgi:hypothetical protein